MSRGLTYADLSSTEQLQYTTIVNDIHSRIHGGAYDAENLQEKLHNDTPRGHRNVLTYVRLAYVYARNFFSMYRHVSRERQSVADLERFIRNQASRRGLDDFDRASFPNFPAGIEPFKNRSTLDPDKTEHAYPDALHTIIETFRDAPPAKRLDMLLEYAVNMPDLPAELLNARDTMEQVDECLTPVFLLAQLHDGKVHYHIDVPRDAPTMRGFAGILRAGLNGATPTAIAATPDDLCQQLGLHKALAPPRLRGLTALLIRIKRNARDLASAV